MVVLGHLLHVGDESLLLPLEADPLAAGALRHSP